MIKTGNCLICGMDMGLFTPKVELKDGYICQDCFNRAGFSIKDGRTLTEFREISINEFDDVCDELFKNSNENPNWDDPDYIIRKVRKTVIYPNLALKDNEHCYFHTNGSIGKKKTRTVRKGKKSYKETYFEKTPCDFYMTSNRFIATVPQGSGFVINMDRILSCSWHKDAFEINHGGKASIVFMTSGELYRFQKTWNLLKRMAEIGLTEDDVFRKKKAPNKAGNSSNDLIIETVIDTDTDTKTAGESLQGEKNSDFKASQKTVEKETSSMNTGAATVNSAAELRRYKALLDEGLITQDDYDALKKKALGL